MPAYMDRHNLPLATSEDLAAAHSRDLEVQHEYGVRFLTYWFDPRDGTGICLAEAPNAEAIEHVHRASHGNTPSEIIAVDLGQVHAFLGRITDPEPEKAEADAAVAGTIGSALRAVVFTDLVDSTTIMQHMGHLEAMQAWDEHNRIITSTVEAGRGSVVKNTGDGYLLSFASVADSIASAIDLQREFAARNARVPRSELHIRVGINAGLPVERSGDLFGSAVNLAARVCAEAGPDEILVTGVMRELCERADLLGRFDDRGRVSLKGFINAVQLYRVQWQESRLPPPGGPLPGA